MRKRTQEIRKDAQHEDKHEQWFGKVKQADGTIFVSVVRDDWLPCDIGLGATLNSRLPS